ncbi:MAG: hypothetical protein C4582_09925 [Desulfobacteraceae bacterium]|nr:MAG: hypothetical protein C4582_09925 [Desulfobacteraceae bacterium]
MKILLCFILIGFYLTIFIPDVFAYLDPATGSMVIQAVLAGIAAVGVSIGVFWRRLKSFFLRSDTSKEKEANHKDEC